MWFAPEQSHTRPRSIRTSDEGFCYDEQNRLTWASRQSASGPCGAHNTVGTLSGAAYTQSFAYDVLDRLTSGPGGSYTYGDWAHHLHGVTAIGSAAYTASYDAAGDLLCRAPDGGTSCSSSPTTGAAFSDDAAGRLAGWQSAPGSSSTTSSPPPTPGRAKQKPLSLVGDTNTTMAMCYRLGLEDVMGSVRTIYLGAGAGLLQGCHWHLLSGGVIASWYTGSRRALPRRPRAISGRATYRLQVPQPASRR